MKKLIKSKQHKKTVRSKAKKPKTSTRHFGKYGGRYVPEMLIPALDELENAYAHYGKKPSFKKELKNLFQNYSGRPTPLYYAKNLTKHAGGCKIYLKLEGANHTGAHKINNALGQILLARHMGKKEIIAETGAGQHGLATATVSARFGFPCKVFMGEVDIKRQYPNVFSMRLLGAEVVPVKDGTKTLKDAVNAALKYWIRHLKDTHYLLGSALGPHPYPTIVRDFQAIIGREIGVQIKKYEKRQPDVMVACVGGGSNSMGMFHPYIKKKTRLIGVEAGGIGFKEGQHATRLSSTAKVGIIQGYKSYFLQNKEGQVSPTHSISAGLDYAGIGPELAYYHDKGRIEFASSSDKETLRAFSLLTRLEGIIPALESSHAIAHGIKVASQLSKNKIMVINVSGRGDKDLFITANSLDKDNWMQFLKSEIELST